MNNKQKLLTELRKELELPQGVGKDQDVLEYTEGTWFRFRVEVRLALRNIEAEVKKDVLRMFGESKK